MIPLSRVTLKLIMGSLLMVLPLVVVCAQDPRIQMSSLDHLAAKASQTVDVNIDQRLIQLAAKLLSNTDPDEAQAKKLVSGLKGIFVKSFEFDADGQYSPGDLESIRSQLRNPVWSRMVNVTSKREGSVEVYIGLQGEQVTGLTVLAINPKELTVVNIVGPIDVDKLAKLEGQFGIPELDIETTKPKTRKDQ